MTRFFLICTFLCVQFFAKAQTQLADSLFLAKNYEKAILAYERLVFQNHNDSVLRIALLSKAYCFKKLRQFEASYNTLQRIDIFAVQNVEERSKILYEAVLMAYLSQQYSEAHFQAQVAKSSEILEAYIKEIRLLEILSLHELSRWEEAQILAKDWATLYAPTIDVEKTYSKKPPFKKVERAKLLSTIVPGLGQVYAGYPFQGLSSLLLQSASLGFGVYSVVNEYYLSGFFTGAGLFQAFYFGGIRHTEFLAEKRNVFLKNRYNQKLAKEFLK